jgi:hypothetical protein
MIAGYVLAESIRPGSRLEGLPLTLTKIERSRIKSATPPQPRVWTTIEFAFPEEEIERVAQALAEVLDDEGGWYTDFSHGDLKFVIFASRIFRYPRGDRTGRAEAQSYGRSVGVPEPQLDWEE